MAKAELTTVVTPKCQRLADEMGYELVDVCLDKENTGKFLRIYVDRPEGMSLDDCERYHRAIMPLVESYDFDFLEVSSPGIDRPLKKDKDFVAAYGTKVDIMFYTPWEGMKNLTGILVAHDDEAVQVKKIIKGKEFKNPDRIERRLIANIRPHIDF